MLARFSPEKESGENVSPFPEQTRIRKHRNIHGSLIIKENNPGLLRTDLHSPLWHIRIRIYGIEWQKCQSQQRGRRRTWWLEGGGRGLHEHPCQVRDSNPNRSALPFGHQDLNACEFYSPSRSGSSRFRGEGRRVSQLCSKFSSFGVVRYRPVGLFLTPTLWVRGGGRRRPRTLNPPVTRGMPLPTQNFCFIL